MHRFEQASDSWAKPQFNAGLVSVIIPTYNRKELIEATLRSVVEQTYRPLQMLIVDDGSSDQSLEYLMRFKNLHADQSLQIEVISQANSGAQVARSRGFIESDGEFIQFLDSDDILYADKITTQVKELEADKDLDLVYSKARAIDHHGEFINTSGEVIASNGEAKLSLSLWATESPLYRRHVCHTVGPWDYDIKGNQEVVYAARVKLHDFSAKFLPLVHSDRINHLGSSISRNSLLPHVRACEFASSRMAELFDKFNIHSPKEWDALATRHLMLAWQYSKMGLKADSQRCLKKGYTMAQLKQKCMFSVLMSAQALFGTRAMIVIKHATAKFQSKLKYALTPQVTTPNNDA